MELYVPPSGSCTYLVGVPKELLIKTETSETLVSNMWAIWSCPTARITVQGHIGAPMEASQHFTQRYPGAILAGAVDHVNMHISLRESVEKSEALICLYGPRAAREFGPFAVSLATLADFYGWSMPVVPEAPLDAMGTVYKMEE